jgi:hypothetical protein
MRIHRLLVVASILAYGALALRANPAEFHQSASAGPQAPEGNVFALLRTIDDVTARQAWPGFRLSDWPIAVFDGTRTLLLHHPTPPPEFTPLPDRPGVLASAGRYPSVVGNSTVDLAGVRTATIVATPGSDRESTLLAYVEELFHVFWLRRHANFRPNEMARYSYPMKDLANLRRRLAEDEAFARALEAPDLSQAAVWAATAVQLRRERNELLSADDRAFEAGTEMMEGTANYVARTAVGLKPANTVTRLRAERAVDQLRWRYYDSGAAICLLLDRVQPDWKTRIDNEPDLTALALLESAVTRAEARPVPFSAAETSQFESKATAAIAELTARQTRVRGELLGRSGPRVVVEIAEGGEPLRVARFDPINLLVLNAGEAAHPRYLTLSNSSGTIEVTNPAYARGTFDGTVTLTSPAGRHPLADGVRTLTVVGLPNRPTIDRRDGRVIIEGEGVRITLRGADARTEGETIRIGIVR